MSTILPVSVEVAGVTRVAALVSGNVTAGRHDVRFDASRISSGMYFYRLESGSLSSVKKMMLLK